MGDWLKRKFAGLVIALLSVGLWMGYHSLFGDGSSGEQLDKTPPKVFAGGGGILSLEINMSHPGRLITSFARGEEEDEEDAIHAEEELSAGEHRFYIDLPPDLTYGYFELGIPDAQPGSTLKWEARFEGRLVASENEKLTEPLGENEAFFLQLEFGDLQELRQYANYAQETSSD